MRDVFRLVCKPLHLTRVVDVGLALSRQSQRSPDLRVLHRAIAVGVERDLDLDHPFQLDRIPPSFGCSLSKRGQQLVAIELFAFARCADQAVPRPTCVFRHLRPTRSHVDRDRLVRPVVDGRVDCLVVLTVKVD